MKRTFTSAAAVAFVTCIMGVANAQTAPATRAIPQSVPQKVGLIDLTRVFKDYKKFNTLREDLKAEILQSEEQVRAMAQQIQRLQAELKTFKEGSPDYLKRESQLAQQASQFEAFRKVAQRDFVRKESQLYKTVYLETLDVVKLYAKYNKYTLVLRFADGDMDASDPQGIMNGLNRQVIFHRPDDNITGPVIDYMNRKYDEQMSAAGAAATPKP